MECGVAAGMNDLVDRLAELGGIEPSYQDQGGKSHTVTGEVKQALAEAMGIACCDQATAEASLQAWQRREWRRLLPPVQVHQVGGELTVPLRLAARDIGRSGSFRLVLESGEILAGKFQPASLTVLERAELEDGEYLALNLRLPACATLGYHRLEVSLDGLPEASMSMILCPTVCYRPPAVCEGKRTWGVGVQLYGVRSERNWGIGDFTDLKTLVEWAAEVGAGVVAVNPLHALSPLLPARCNPYCPSNQQFLNLLYLDVEAVPEFAECDEARALVTNAEFQARLRALRAAPLVDYGEVAGAKFQVLAKLYRHFREHHLAAGTPRARAFRAWVKAQGEELDFQALFDALQVHFVQHGNGRNDQGWLAWPKAYHDPNSAEVKAFAQANQEQINYHRYLYWLAACQLHAVGWRSLELGLDIGLLQDLALRVDRGGAETWRQRELYALTASVGAPPEDGMPDHHLSGCVSGRNLVPWIPHRLREVAYQLFIRAVRVNMQEAGALRIDLAGLRRQYWVPAGRRAGGYVRYPFQDLIAILALESQRNRCLVIGSGQLFMAEEVQRTAQKMGVLTSRLFYFEKHWQDDQSFKAPAELAPEILVTVSDYHVPPLAGFWRGVDLDLRTELGLFPTQAQREAEIVGRAQDQARLLVALEREGLLPEGMSVHPVAVPEMTPLLALAVHQYLARSPARVLLVQIQDMLGELNPVSLPGTTSEYPNWQHKLSLNLEEWPKSIWLARFAEVMVAERGTSVTPSPLPELPACSPASVPRATYRLQLSRAFTFLDAKEIVPYLAELGISHLYLSPILRARPGSQHGYDIIDHTSLNPELGSPEDFEALLDTLEQYGMGVLLDLVPNHMGVMGADNRWWLDVLENGLASDKAEYFDIDWQPVKPELKGKVQVPVLGDHYGVVLESGWLKLVFDADAGEFSVWYFQHRFPVDPKEYPQILTHRIELLGARLGPEHPDFLEYQSLVTAFSHLPSSCESDPARRAERARDKEIYKRHLAELAARNSDILFFLRENVELFNAIPGETESLLLLDRLLSAQPYRLAYWRVAADEINYRRFFDINDLAALRMEREEVFAATHELIGALMARRRLRALRIDHADGLYAPGEYFARLRRLYREMQPTATEPLYLVVEKILAPHERLPSDWQICGTTGYDFANLVGGLFVDPASAEAMERIWRNFSERREPFDEILYQSKRAIMQSVLASELNMLANRLVRIAEMDRHTRDYTFIALRRAIFEVAACFPVYRTYIVEGQGSEQDRQHIEWACNVAKKRSRAADVSVFDFLRQVLLTTIGEGKNEAYRQAVLEFAMRFQQFTGPVAAKGMEDTAFYRYHRLVSLNEVGGDPRRFGVTVSAFHHANQERVRYMPYAMLATSTHDSKRSEDVRMRIHVLSEIPDEWRRMTARWHRLNRSRLGWIDGVQAPTRSDEYMLYQTLVGTWPFGENVDFAAYADRIRAYMVKAVREAKEVSSWINPDLAYEEKLVRFVDAVLPPQAGQRFLQEFVPFAARIAHFGRLGSLAQTLLKLTCPGVPDIYQGAELWTDSLVDPDNRRPVDYELRISQLNRLVEREAKIGRLALCRELLANLEEGAVKLYLIRCILALRRTWPDLFAQGDYQPVTATGPARDHLVAFTRTFEAHTLVAVAPRLIHTLLRGAIGLPQGSQVWANTHLELPKGRWRNVLTEQELSAVDGILAVSQVLSAFPVGLLVRA